MYALQVMVCTLLLAYKHFRGFQALCKKISMDLGEVRSMMMVAFVMIMMVLATLNEERLCCSAGHPAPAPTRAAGRQGDGAGGEAAAARDPRA